MLIHSRYSIFKSYFKSTTASLFTNKQNKMGGPRALRQVAETHFFSGLYAIFFPTSVAESCSNEFFTLMLRFAIWMSE
jgi:hypothetical protein